MIGFIFNPPRKGRGAAHRKLGRRSISRRKLSRSGMAWKRSVAKHGVLKAAALRRSKRRAARKAGRARKLALAQRKVVANMPKRRSHRRARRRKGVSRRRARRMKSNPVNPPRRHRRRRSRRGYRRNAWRGHRKAHRRAALKGLRRRSHRRSRRRSYRRNSWFKHPKLHRRAAKKAWRRHRRTMLPAVRRNVRKALNKKFGVRSWVKHSRAKWNPGTTMSLKAAGASIMDVFTMESVYDGLAIGGGIVGALALPGVISKALPASWRAALPFSLTSGWGGYAMNAVSAGLLGYAAGLAFGSKVGKQVFLGGIGATIAKLILDKVGFIKASTGVTLSGYGDYGLQKMIEQEVAAELQGNMGEYLTPAALTAAGALGDYATPSDMLSAGALGEVDEFNESDEFDS